MNTHGHHRIADEAGLPRLRQAFADLGIDDINLSAFYMGNWLTDLSQVKDPKASCLTTLGKDIGKRLMERMGTVIAQLHAIIEAQVGPHQAPAEVAGDPVKQSEWAAHAKELLREAASQAVADFVKTVEQLVASFADLAGKKLNEVLKAAVKFSAYSKFAHPDPAQRKPGLDFRVFSEIFERNFTQYFPHEHLDRPHCQFTLDSTCTTSWGRHAITSKDRVYASLLATGESCIGNQAPSIYKYLDECRRVVSASLGVVDRDWAAKYLTTGVDYRNDIGFHRGLADLGHALHAVEDFFAHSNFIEHAAATKGEPYLRRQLYGPGKVEWLPSTTRRILERSESDFSATKVFRRLKRFAPDVDGQENRVGWAFLPDESSIVTGYFDCWDTLMSLLHALEEMFEFDRAEMARDPFSDYLKRYKDDRADEILEPIADIVAIFKQETVEGKLRKDLRVLLDYYTENRRLDGITRDAAARDIRGTIQQRGLFRNVAPAILDVVVTLVYLLVDSALVKVQSARIGWNLYQLIKTAVEIFRNPLGFLAEPFNNKPTEGGWFSLKFQAAWIYQIFFDARLDAARFELRTKLHEMLGGYRVGSHSLLAKDYTDEPLFPQAFNCARALHWYVVDTMCRWTDVAWLEQSGDDSTWVDWDELLAAFLRHPLAYQQKAVIKPESVSVTAWEPYHVAAAGETFRTIAVSKIRGPAFNGARYGSYEEILIANLGSRRLFRADAIGGTNVDEASVASQVVEARMGTPDSSSYQLRVGLTVWVPVTVDFTIDRASEAPWYSTMMDLDSEAWQQQMAAYRRDKPLMSQPPFEYHRVTYFVAKDRETGAAARDRSIEEGVTLRQTLEAKYNKPNG